MAAAVAATLERFGGLDILVANAGTEGTAEADGTLSRRIETLLPNVTGVWLTIKHCVAP